MTETMTAPNPPQTAAPATRAEVTGLESNILVKDALNQTPLLSDITFGGGVLVLVIMIHAFLIRYITSAFLRRSEAIKALPRLWRADLLFANTVIALLVLHLAEIMIWTAALLLSGIVGDWSRSAYFAANCYTALGEPFSLPKEWRLVPPIIAISGIFTFAWTASVLVDFVSRYNAVRAGILAKLQGD